MAQWSLNNQILYIHARIDANYGPEDEWISVVFGGPGVVEPAPGQKYVTINNPQFNADTREFIFQFTAQRNSFRWTGTITVLMNGEVPEERVLKGQLLRWKAGRPNGEWAPSNVNWTLFAMIA